VFSPCPGHGALQRAAGEHLHQLQAVLDRCSEAGGGVVVVPPGDYLIGTLMLKDNTHLELSAGATLYCLPPVLMIANIGPIHSIPPIANRGGRCPNFHKQKGATTDRA